MKYDQLKHKEYLESRLLKIFLDLGIEEDRLSSITIAEIREIIDQNYPVLTPITDESKLIHKKKLSLTKEAINIMYYYSLIKKREQQ